MKTVNARWMVLPLLALAILPAAARVAAQEDRRGVNAAVGQFYAALNDMFKGDLTAMKPVWSHRDDVTYMGPGGGFRVGWTAVLADWESQARMKLGGKVTPAEIQFNVGTDLAVVSNYERGENVDATGKVQKVEIRATNIFRKESGVWKMIGHHTDLLPYLKN